MLPHLPLFVQMHHDSTGAPASKSIKQREVPVPGSFACLPVAVLPVAVLPDRIVTLCLA